MFSRRFKETMTVPIPPTSSAFVLLPVNTLVPAWWQWVYQVAFEQAHQDMQAERRSRLLAVSLN